MRSCEKERKGRKKEGKKEKGDEKTFSKKGSTDDMVYEEGGGIQSLGGDDPRRGHTCHVQNPTHGLTAPEKKRGREKEKERRKKV